MMGGIGRARVHGALRGRRERRGARAAATRPTWRSRAPSRSRSSCPPAPAARAVHTPGATTIEAVAGSLGVPRGRAAQGLPGRRRGPRPGRSCSCAATTASTRSSSQNALRRAVPARPSAEEVRERIGAARASSARSAPTCRRAARRRAARPGGRTSRAPTSRTCTCAASSRAATSSSSAPTCARWRPATRSAASPIAIEPAIEVGNIFKLGTRYSEPLGATLPRRGRHGAADRDGLLRDRARAHRRGRRRAVRRRAAASPGRARWRPSTSSWCLGKPAREERDAAERSTRSCARRASTSLYDDRDAGAGREVRRRRAARLPAAPDGRARALEAGERRGAGPARADGRKRALPLEGAAAAAAGGAVAPSLAPDVPAAGRASTAPARRRPQTRAGAPLQPVDDPERDRLRPARADPGLPRRSRCRRDDGTDALPRRSCSR